MRSTKSVLFGYLLAAGCVNMKIIAISHFFEESINTRAFYNARTCFYVAFDKKLTHNEYQDNAAAVYRDRSSN